MPVDPYGRDVLASDWRRRPDLPEVEAERDLVVEEAVTGFCGAVVAVEKMPGGIVVVLEDRLRRRRSFPLGPGFLVDGRAIRLVRPRPRNAPTGPRRTASGSVAVAGQRARVARASRILVEGRHDAELVEKVWGDDLRVEGVVVEMLDGIDNLPAVLSAISPSPQRRVGVLVDHLVAGSKESRVAASVRSAHVHVVGHPYVDVWAAVRPAAVGIPAWPDVPRGLPWKEGVCAALGWPHDSPADLAAAWRRVLGAVQSHADLEPDLLGRVEELIDFVTVG